MKNQTKKVKKVSTAKRAIALLSLAIATLFGTVAISTAMAPAAQASVLDVTACEYFTCKPTDRPCTIGIACPSVCQEAIDNNLRARCIIDGTKSQVKLCMNTWWYSTTLERLENVDKCGWLRNICSNNYKCEYEEFRAFAWRYR